MASVYIQDENKQITDPDAIRSFLKPFGIWYEKWDVEGRLPDSPSDQDILNTYAPEIQRLKEQGGFVTADVINVSPATPNLDILLAKFDKEHTHSEDEVRFTVSGKGVFHIHPETGPVFEITVESGDLINVPRGTKHWFSLCTEKHIRCIRLFEDMSGWTPHYVPDAVHAGYQPLCFGGEYIRSEQPKFESVIKP
jgi:1,2-dihydroxy-3-keto-5-methylthiopentene dioxygenase